MYANAQSYVHIGEGYSEEFEVKIGVHQGSVLYKGKEKLPRSQTDRAGHESPGEDCGWPHQTVGVNR